MRKLYLSPALRLIVLEQDVILKSDITSNPNNLGNGDWGVQDEL